MKNYLVIIFLTITFIVVRLFLVDQQFLLHDERDIVLSGYSIAQTGKDLFGYYLPLKFDHISPQNPLFAIYYSALWWKIFPYRSVFFARLQFIIISALLIILIYLLINFLTKNKIKALLVSLIFCFSPWIFHITRLALDIPLAIVTLIAGVFLYLKRKTFLSYLLFLITFYTYQGFRLLIPFLIFYLEIFFFIKERNKLSLKKGLFLNFFFIFILFSSILIIDHDITKNRLREIIFFDSEKNSREVIFRRMTSIAPEEIKVIFNNKLTVALDYVLTNFIKGQDLIYLFKEGDYSAINGNIASGQFFFVLLIFYYLGIISLGRKSKIEDFYIIGFIPIGLIPALLSVHGSSFSIRGMFSGIGYAYIIVLGILFSQSILKKIRYQKLIIAIFILSLIINLIFFFYTYFFRRPILVGEIFNENERQLANYLLSHRFDKKDIYHHSPQDIYLSLIFLDNRADLNKVQINLKKSYPYRWENYTFHKCDHKINYTLLKNAIIEERCLTPKLYEYFNNLDNIKVATKIPYKDYSYKNAYFIIK